jgi:xanthosine phosphorylase
MSVSFDPASALAAIAKRAPHFKPTLGLVLGSGLGSLADQITDAIIIPYAELPNFPISTVAGHSGKLILGWLNGLPVACLQGRVHYYEGTPPQAVKILIRTLRALGCEYFLATNASGSLRKDVGPGELMMITDHINLQILNPLVGANDEDFGSRFIAMNKAYDEDMQQRLLNTAGKLDIRLEKGVYISVFGPCFETAAEIRAFRILGADAVGMSTVPEVIIARHCGLRVAVVAAITNFGAGMSDETITHEGTLHFGQIAAKNMAKLVSAFAGSLQHEPC